MPRILKSEHVSIGWTASSESRNAKWKGITTLSIYPATSLHGSKIVGITAKSGVVSPVTYLNPNGAIEVVKGLLQYLTKDAAITMVADDEFRAILEQVKVAIQQGDDDSRAVVAACRESIAYHTKPKLPSRAYREAYTIGQEAVRQKPLHSPENPYSEEGDAREGWDAGADSAGINIIYTNGVLNKEER